MDEADDYFGDFGDLASPDIGVAEVAAHDADIEGALRQAVKTPRCY